MSEKTSWDEAERVRDLPEVDEAIRNLLADHTGDNATCVVQAVMDASRLPSVIDAPLLPLPGLPEDVDEGFDATAYNFQTVDDLLRRLDDEGARMANVAEAGGDATVSHNAQLSLRDVLEGAKAFIEHLEDYIGRRVPVPASSPKGWEPMESAPRDGKRFLIAVDVCATGDVSVWDTVANENEHQGFEGIEPDDILLGWMPSPVWPASPGEAQTNKEKP